MKLIFAAKNIDKLKMTAFRKAVGRPSATGPERGNAGEQALYERCGMFFTHKGFLECFKMIVPPENVVMYNSMYDGALADMAKGIGQFDGFLGENFDARKIDKDGKYKDFKNDCFSSSLAGKLRDTISLLNGSLKTIVKERKMPWYKDISNAMSSYQNGMIGTQEFHDRINSVQNGLASTNSVDQAATPSDAGSNLKQVIEYGKYTCYEIRRWADLNAIAGLTNWCVAKDGKSGRNFFDGDGDEDGNNGYIYPNYDKDGNPTSHLSDPKNAYYIICDGKSPVALFNVSTTTGQCQFKNTGDRRIAIDRPSSNDIIEIGERLREMLGEENNYSDDFKVFEEYESKGGFREEGEKKSTSRPLPEDKKPADIMFRILRDPGLMEEDGNYEIVVNRILHGELYRDPSTSRKVLHASERLLDDTRVIDYIASSYVISTDRQRYNDHVFFEVISDNPSLVRKKSIHDAIVMTAIKKNDMTDASLLHVMSDPAIIEHLASKKNLIYSNNLNCMLRDPAVFRDDRMLDVFVNTVIPGHNIYLKKTFENAPWLLEKPEVIGALVKSFAANHDIISGLVNDFPHIVENPGFHAKMVECIRNNQCKDVWAKYKRLQDDPEMVEALEEQFRENPDKADLEVFSNMPGLIDHSALRNELVNRINSNWTACKCLSESGVGFEKHDDLMSAVLSIGDKSGELDWMTQSVFFSIAMNHPSVLSASDKVHDKFIGMIGSFDSASYWGKIIDNDAIFDDPEVRKVFIEFIGKQPNWIETVLTSHEKAFLRKDVLDAVVGLFTGNEDSLDIKSWMILSINAVARDPRIVNMIMRRIRNRSINRIGYGDCMAIKNNPDVFKKAGLEDALASCLERPDSSSVEKFIYVVNTSENSGLLRSDKIIGTIADNIEGLVYSDDEMLKNEFLVNIIWRCKERGIIEDLRVVDAIAGLGEKIGNGKDDDRKRIFWELVSEYGELMRNGKIRSEFKRQFANGGKSQRIMWNVLKDNPSLAGEFDQSMAGSLADAIGSGDSEISKISFGIAGDNPSFLSNDRICNAVVGMPNDDFMQFMYKHPKSMTNRKVLERFKKIKLNEGLSTSICRNSPSIEAIRHCLNCNPNNGDMYMHVIEHNRGNVDEHKMMKFCEEFAYKDWSFLDRFINRFEKKFADEVWEYALKSNYVFETIKNYGDLMPRQLLEEMAGSNDKDVKYIAGRFLKKHDAGRTSSIARKIARSIVISERVAGSILRMLY